MRFKKKCKVLLSIAGSDNSSGAGIQCDLKTSSALKVYCVSCVSAITSQNSREVKNTFFLTKDLVISQLKTILSDFKIDCIKIGLFNGIESAKAVVNLFKKEKINIPIVVDPIFKSTTKSQFLKKSDYLSTHRVFSKLNPIFTPNLIEIKTLMDINSSKKVSKQKLVRMFYDTYKCNVILTAGDDKSDFCKDYLLDETLKIKIISSKKIISRNSHGSGCAFSTALSIYLARGLKLYESAILAKKFTERSIKLAPNFDLDYGPVGQFSLFK